MKLLSSIIIDIGFCNFTWIKYISFFQVRGFLEKHDQSELKKFIFFSDIPEYTLLNFPILTSNIPKMIEHLEILLRHAHLEFHLVINKCHFSASSVHKSSFLDRFQQPCSNNLLDDIFQNCWTFIITYFLSEKHLFPTSILIVLCTCSFSTVIMRVFLVLVGLILSWIVVMFPDFPD